MTTTVACVQPVGYVSDNTDCDDADADVNPAATEMPGNGKDDDCDGLVDEGAPAPQVNPSVTTQAATDVTRESATLNMSYTVGDYASVDVRFAYKESADSAWSHTDWVSKSESDTYAEGLTELDSNTEYEFKAQLKYDGTVMEGNDLHFTTAACFIATAAYGTPASEQIGVLREFRDIVLLESTTGSQFVTLYYQISSPVADLVSRNGLLRTLVRELLVDPIVWVVEAAGHIWRN
jgi:hypothetical protein